MKHFHRQSSALLTTLLAACAAPPPAARPPPPPVLTASPAPPPAPVFPGGCVVKGADADVDSVVVSDIEILFCVESRSPPPPGEPAQPRACFRFDRTIARFAAIPVTPRPPEGQPEHVDRRAWAHAADGVIRICRPGQPACEEVARYSPDGGTPEVATDGVHYLACQACSTLEVRDRSGAVVLRIQPWKSEALGTSTFFRTGHFTYDMVIAMLADTAVSTEARVFDRRGHQVLAVGRVADHAPHQVGVNWAFELAAGEGLAVFELHAGRRLATYPLLLTGPREARPQLALVTPTFGGGLTALHTRRQAGDVVLYADAAPAKVVHPPYCP
jgi:hypothetical protein